MLRRNWPVLVIIFAPVFVLWRCLFLGEVIGPWEEIKTFSPWQAAPPNRPYDVLQMDAALQFYVWRDLVLESWGRGQVPLWNPYQLGGVPLLANSQSGALYPLHILAGVLHLPTSVAITLLAWFHLAWAGLGVYSLSRRLGGNELIAGIAGLSLTLSCFFVSWTGLSSVITTCAWLPWALWGLVGVWESDRPWKPAAAFGGSLAMMFLGGHLQFAAFGVLALIVFGAVSLFEWKPAVSRVGIALAGPTAGLLVASPHLIAVLQFSQFSHRRGAPTASGWEAYRNSAMQWWEIASLGSGDLLGSSARFGPEATMPSSNFWPQFYRLGSNYAESAVAVGACVVIFASVALCQKARGTWSLAGVAVLGLLVAIASPIAQALYFGFPGWSATGSPGRAAVLIVLALCALAGTAKLPEERIDLRRSPFGRGLLIGLAFAGLGALLIRLIVPGMPSLFGAEAPPALAELVQGGIGQFGGVTVIVGVGLIIAMGINRWQRHRSALFWTAGTLALIPGLMSAPLRTGTLPPSPDVSRGTRIAVLNRGWSLNSYPTSNIFPPNLASMYRFVEVGGYDSLIHRDDVARLRALNGGADPAPQANGNMMFVKTPENLHTGIADEVWVHGSIPGWEGQLIAEDRQFRRYRVTKTGVPEPKKRAPDAPNFLWATVGCMSLLAMALSAKRPQAPE